MIGLHGLGNVFHLPLTQEKVIKGQFLADGAVYRLGDADTPRFGQGLQSRGHVNPIAIDLISVNDDFAQIDADPKLNLAVIGKILVTTLELLLNGRRAKQRVRNRGEICQHRIARKVHHGAVVPFNGIGDEVEGGAEHAMCSLLILPGQAAVASDIRIEDGSEFAF